MNSQPSSPQKIKFDATGRATSINADSWIAGVGFKSGSVSEQSAYLLLTTLKPQITTIATDTPPSSMRPAWERIVQLARETGAANWDREGARAIPPARWIDVARFLTRMQAWFRSPMPPPFVSPAADGAIFISWIDALGRRLEFELTPDRAYWTEEGEKFAVTSGEQRPDEYQAIAKHVSEHLGL